MGRTGGSWFVLGAAAALFGSTAARAEEPARWYGAVLGSYVVHDAVRTLDPGAGAQGLIGFPLSPSLSWETALHVQTSDLEVGDDPIDAVGLGVALNFHPAGRQPYLLIGVGAQRDDADGGTETSPYADAGAGFVLPPLGDTGLRLRAEARANVLFNDDLSTEDDDAVTDFRLSLGVQFGAGAASAAPARSGAAKTAAASGKDEGEDKVVDLDKDGVPFPLDLCNRTPAGMTVDKRGCVVLDKVVLGGVAFERGSARLSSKTQPVLEAVVSALLADRELRLEIAGYSDSRGKKQSNLDLSRRRAETVRQRLVDLGIPSARLVAKGYGESSPVASNDTEGGRARNRRVEFHPLD